MLIQQITHVIYKATSIVSVDTLDAQAGTIIYVAMGIYDRMLSESILLAAARNVAEQLYTLILKVTWALVTC